VCLKSELDQRKRKARRVNFWPMSQQVSLVTGDGYPIFREGLRRLLEAEGGFKVIGEASGGELKSNTLKSLTEFSSAPYCLDTSSGDAIGDGDRDFSCY
jgi:hypothetical protein